MKSRDIIRALGRANQTMVVCLLALAPSLASAGDLTADNLTLYGDADIYGELVIHPYAAVRTTNENRVLYFDFSTSTTPVPDDSGNSNTGVVSGAAWTSGGIRDGAYDFDGTNDTISVASVASLNIATAITVAAWVKTTKTTGWTAIVCKGQNTERNYDFRIESGKLNFHHMTGGISMFSVASTTTVADGAWHSCVGTWDKSTVRVYVDGIQENTASYTNALVTNSYPLVIGRTPTYSQYVDGLIDEVMVYNSALSSQAVYNIYLYGVSNANPTNVFMGPVGIGTNSPEATLDVAGDLKVGGNINLNGNWLSGDGDNEGVFVSSDGKVGVGTSNPAEKLHVDGVGRFDDGINYVYPLGDVGMGVYTNQ